MLFYILLLNLMYNECPSLICFNVYSLGLQVLYSILIVREDVDIRSWVIDDLHRINGCVQIKLGEVINTLISLRNS